jgi:LPXTG-site transpeptidase (sortase) family protein
MNKSQRLSLLVAVSLLLSMLLTILPEGNQPASAAYEIRPNTRVYLDPSINKKFVPISIPPGGTSRLTVYVYNPNDYELVNVAWTDQLDKIQPGIQIASNPQVVSTCGGTVSAVAGSNIFSLTGGTVGPKVGVVNGECEVSVNVTSFTPGNLDNEFVPGDLTAQDIPEEGDPVFDFTNPTGVIETLNVADIDDPSIWKTFSPDSLWVGQRTRLRVNIRNNDDTYTLHQVSLTDNLPADMEVADPLQTYIHPNCGSSANLTASPGDTSFTLNDAEIPASASCYYDVYVQGNAEGSRTNTIPADSLTSYELVTNPSPATDTIFMRGVQMYKAFSPDRILAGEDTLTLTITIQNPYTEKLTNAALTDALPGGQLTFIPGTESTTCEEAGSPASFSFTNSDQTITITNATVPAGVNNDGAVIVGSCTITVNATAPGSAGGGSWLNSLPPGTLTNDENHPNQNTTQDWFYIDPQSIAVYKTFTPTRFQENGQTTVRIRLTNPTSTVITGVDITDVLPTNMIPVTPAITNTTCGGTVTVDEVSDPRTISLNDGTIGANSNCYFEAAVTYQPTTPLSSDTSVQNCVLANSITTDGGITNQSQDCENVTVYPEDLGVTASKTFSTNGRLPSETQFYVDLRYTAPQDETLYDVSITDNLPAGLVISNPTAPSISGCGSSYVLSAPDGGDTFTLTGGQINAASQCSIRLYIEALYPGTFTNQLLPTDFGNTSDQTHPNTPSDTITISDFRVAKSFSPIKIARGGKTALTVTMYNDNDAAIVSGTLNDRLNTMGTGQFVIADPANFTSTCPAITFNSSPGDSIVEISDLEINPNSNCSYSVTIQAQSTATIGNNRNTIARTDGSVQWDGIPGSHQPRDNAIADLQVAEMDLEIVKNFDPSAVFGGSSSKMSILLINPNDIDLTDISFEDFMPVGMEASQPYNIDTSTCGGTVTVAGDRQSFSYEGGSLAAGRRCTISINTTIRVNGNLVNTIPAGAVTTYEGVTNPDAASSTLTNLPGISVQKYFTPNQILADPEEYSTLTLFFRNTGNAPVDDLGLIDAFPAGMYVADGSAPAPTSDCGGTLTANPGDTQLVLAGGALAGAGLTGDTCTLTVSVEADENGSYRNVIEAGDVTSDDPNGTNPDPAEDTLIVYGTPAMEISKSVSNLGGGSGADGIFIEGDTIEYSILVTNTGDIALPNVVVTDPGTDVSLTGCSPVNGSDLAAGDSMTCTAEHVVTADDILLGSFTNVAFAESDKTDPVSDDEVVPLTGGPAISIDKQTISSPPYVLNSTITYEIVVRNLGTITLNNVTVTDPGIDVVLGVCSPANGSSLAVGASMTCAATHVVTQVDVDAGLFSNTAYADSDETDPVEDTVDVPISQFPGLAVYKYEITSGIYAVGDMVDFEIVVQNTGNTTLTNVTVTDTGTELPLGDCTKNEDPAVIAMPTTLLVGERIYCEALHQVTQADIDAGEYTNVAIGDSDETEPETGEETVVMVQIPGISLVKTGTLNDGVVAPTGRVDAGDTITYTFRVQNTGNVTLSNISISDAVVGVVITGGPITLAPGQVDTTTFTGTYAITQADIDAGTFTNTATVSSESPTGSIIRDDDDDTQTFAPRPAIELVKTGTLNDDVVLPAGQVNEGDTITYTFTMTNTGNVTLSDITITDAIPGVTILGGPITLEPGDSDAVTFTGLYTLTQVDVDAGTFTNTATVSGTDPNDTEVTDDDDDTQTWDAEPSITLVKTGTLNDGVVAPTGVVNIGDTITYTFTVTNTGNVTLSDITITDAIPGVVISGGPITLAPGEVDSSTFTGVFTMTQSVVDALTFTNTATVSGTDPHDTEVTDDDDDTKTWDAVPSIALEKTGVVNDNVVAPTGVVNVGDTITYTFTFTNTGNVTLYDITLVDTVGGVTITGGPIASLAGGASDSTTFSGTYTLTQADVDSGTFGNSATVSGTDPYDSEVTDDDDDVRNWDAEPSIELVKTGTLNDDVVLPAGQVNEGDTITYTFTVTNTGNVTLYDITLADTVGGVTINGGPIASLAPGDSDGLTFTGSYTLAQSDVDAGTFTNTATVSGTDPHSTVVTDDDDDTRNWDAEPSITLVKTGTLNDGVVAPTGVVNVGDTITYTFTVTNTGNVTLSDITIDDAIAGVTILGGPVTLAPGASDSVTFTGSYTLTQPDVDAGTFTNTATVSGTDPFDTVVIDDDDDTKSWDAEPSIELVKTGTLNDDVVAPVGQVDEGDTITYTFTVTNTGNVTLYNITLTDTVGGVTISGGPIASLAPGASNSTTFSGTYTLTLTDINSGSFTNTATVSGTDPHSTVVTDDDDDTQTLAAAPAIEVVKTGTLNDDVVAPAGQVNEGDTITYTFTVTNTGNVTLSDITITDAIPDVVILGGPITLVPGASDTSTFTAAYTLTQADVDAGTFTNTATASGTDPHDTEVSDDDDDTQTWDAEPSIDLQKEGALNLDVVEPDDEPDEGDTITYTFTVTNTGNVTLYDITLADTVGGVTISGGPITSLAPGAVDDTTFSGTYTLTQADVDGGSFTNTATVTGTDPHSTVVTDEDDDQQDIDEFGMLGVAKRVSSGPTRVSAGIWQFSYEIYVENYANVTLSNVQVTDDLSAIFGTPHVFSVVEVVSTDLVLNPAYDGESDIQLLAEDANVLEVGESGMLTITVELIPANGGPFENTALGTATTPSDEEVIDLSQDGTDPDPDDDDDPSNNEDPTPLDFGPNLFDPPFGIKIFDNAGLPLLRWTMIWINDTNIVAINAAVSDSIPPGTQFVDDGVPSGSPLPTGTLPAGSTTNGVTCGVAEGVISTTTTTTYCYYEGPTTLYPRGRIVWEGTLGPDLGATDAEEAINELYITFAVRVNGGVTEVNNTGTIGADLDGDGVIEGEEVVVAEADARWYVDLLPETGFAPGVITQLPLQPAELAYQSAGIVLEIPRLGVRTDVVTIPFRDGGWDVTWLGNSAGYLEGSAYPTWEGNTVITAHNWTPLNQPGIFADLNDLMYGDQIKVHAFGQTYTYEIRSRQLISSRNLYSAFKTESLDWVTLMTCESFDETSGDYRFRRLVRAVLVSVE